MKRAPQRDTRPQRKESSKRSASEAPTLDIVYGFRSALALCEKRPDDIDSLLVTRERAEDVEDLLAWAEGQEIPFEIVDAHDLRSEIGTETHEGILVRARPRTWLTPNAFGESLVKSKGIALALDRVRNPYNIGAILRTAAFFGVQGVLLGAPAPHPGLPNDAIRVAEGGAEHLAFARTTDLAESLRRLRSLGVQVVAGDTEGEGVHDATTFAFGRPVVLVVGNEREGLSDRVLDSCDARIAIGGTGAMESLNVSVATSILIAAMARTSKAPRAS